MADRRARYQQLRAIRGTFGYQNRSIAGSRNRSGRNMVNIDGVMGKGS